MSELAGAQALFLPIRMILTGRPQLTVRSLALVICGAALVLTSCRGQPQPDSPAAVPGTGSATLAGMPQGADEQDRMLIEGWMQDNEACVGGIDVRPDVPVCKARDLGEARLRKKGWCWGAPTTGSAAENDWHQRGTYDTDDMSESGQAAARSTDDPWNAERDRVKSPLLQAYENAIEPIYQKMGLAQVMLECGIRGQGWHGATVLRLQNFLRGPQLEEMRARLDPAEAAAATTFRQSVIDGELALNFGSDKAAACRDIGNMPFVNNEAAFLP